MHHQHREVVVIGAGLSGLVCAYRLRQLGVEVLLLERSPHVGGVIQSEQTEDGFLLERGPNSARGTAELMALIDELGIQEELIEGNPRAPAYVFFKGSLRAVPMNPLALIKSELLSARGKLRLLREPFIKKRASADEESVAGFISRRLGSEIAERLVAPFVSGIYAGDEKRLSIQAAFPQMANLESDYGSLFRGAVGKLKEAKQAVKTETDQQKPQKSKTRRSISFRSGMSTLTETLAEHIGESLLLNSECRLRGNDGDASGRFLLEINRQGDAEAVTCDHLVLATPAYTAATFLNGLSEEISQLLDEIEYPPLAILHLAYEQSEIDNPLDGFGFLAAPSEGLKILGCIFNSSQFAQRAPEGWALMTIFIGGARNPDLVSLDDDELVAAAHEELQTILGIATAPRVLSVTRWQHSIPQYNIGHAARVRNIEAGIKEIAGLALIGNYLHGVSVGDCVKEAEQAAANIKKHSPIGGLRTED